MKLVFLLVWLRRSVAAHPGAAILIAASSFCLTLVIPIPGSSNQELTSELESAVTWLSSLALMGVLALTHFAVLRRSVQSRVMLYLWGQSALLLITAEAALAALFGTVLAASVDPGPWLGYAKIARLSAAMLCQASAIGAASLSSPFRISWLRDH